MSSYANLITIIFAYSFVGMICIMFDSVSRWLDGNGKMSFKQATRVFLISPLVVFPLYLVYIAAMCIVEVLRDKE